MTDLLNKINPEIKPELVCQLIAGSHLYGMANAGSDIDYRLIYKSMNPVYVYGLREAGTVCTVSDDIDMAIYELSHFVRLMAKTNTQMAEMLFANDEDVLFCSKDFSRLRENRFRLLDSEKLFKSLCGYLQNERRLAMGERSGQLGGKRKAALEEYGFSYKNVVQFCRLSLVGAGLFLDGDYIVNMKDHPSFEFLMNIKNNPGSFAKEKVAILLDEHEQVLFNAYANKRFTFTFDYELAGEILKDAYNDRGN